MKKDTARKCKKGLSPKQVQPVLRPISGIDHTAPASHQYGVDASGQFVAAARYHVKLY
ncbi:hypothetical protein [Endothiovibrio diazotrophicus]